MYILIVITCPRSIVAILSFLTLVKQNDLKKNNVHEIETCHFFLFFQLLFFLIVTDPLKNSTLTLFVHFTNSSQVANGFNAYLVAFKPFLNISNELHD